MPTMDQVAWANCNVTTGGETQPYSRGALLPEPVTPEELSERGILRSLGAIRVVDVVYSAEELAEQAQQRAAATAQREAAVAVDPSLPLAQQLPGTAVPGRPTLIEPSGAPVVIGDEDLRTEHEQAAAEAGQRRGEEAPRRPSAGGSKAAWVEYATAAHGVSKEDAEAMTRDQLRDRYGPDKVAEAATRAQADVAGGLHQPTDPAPGEAGDDQTDEPPPGPEQSGPEDTPGY